MGQFFYCLFIAYVIQCNTPYLGIGSERSIMLEKRFYGAVLAHGARGHHKNLVLMYSVQESLERADNL